VSYLRNISKHGALYRTKVTSCQGVHLQHSKKYHLRDPESRGDFFRLVARLLWYLSSGKSHVPYLWNRPDNPINTVLIYTCLANDRVLGLMLQTLQCPSFGMNHKLLGQKLYTLQGITRNSQVLCMKSKVYRIIRPVDMVLRILGCNANITHNL
jgi:hypothetical protein